MAKPVDNYNVTMLAEGLAVLAATQREVGKAIPGWVEGEPEYVRTTFLALMVETAELLQELNWKPWKADHPIDTSRAADEFADILAFLGYVVAWLEDAGIPIGQLAMQYQAKTKINIKRLAGEVEGYGVKPKTPSSGV